jgi:hypothetical protein
MKNFDSFKNENHNINSENIKAESLTAQNPEGRDQFLVKEKNTENGKEVKIENLKSDIYDTFETEGKKQNEEVINNQNDQSRKVYKTIDEVKKSKNFLKRTTIALGFLVAGLFSNKEATAQKTKTYTDSVEYVKAKKLYEDSLELYKNSYSNLRKIERQTGIVPEIYKSSYPPFAGYYAKHHDVKNFIGYDGEEKQIKDLIGPRAPTSFGDIKLKPTDTYQSLYKIFLKAREKYLIEERKNQTIKERVKGQLSKDKVVYKDGKLGVGKESIKYDFYQKIHSSIRPTERAIFNFGAGTDIISGKKEVFNKKDIFEKKQIRSTNDFEFNSLINRYKSDQTKNPLFKIFGDTKADGKEFYIYELINRDYSNQTVDVFLYKKPTTKPVYKPQQDSVIKIQEKISPQNELKNIETKTISEKKVEKIPACPWPGQHRRSQGLGLLRRRRDGRAGITRRHQHGRSRRPRQLSLRDQLQLATSRWPSTRQRQHHP